ncbi:hypothetical protein J4Q44_G00285630 [Coregonus suidteri]|uniref:Uncharacterized protein n=1 Tax=Coregonus suidteri TaxID=861788 RepID=A0AAN8L3F7_9TELE
MMDQKLRPIEQQLQYLLNKADEFQAHLLYRRDNLQKENFARVVPTFLRTCQPYFTYLESTARSSLPQRTPLPVYIRSREAEPASISHFYIGKCQIDSVRLSIYRYCCPAPYLAGVDTGLYKRMRWNVERPRESLQQETDGEMEGETEEDKPVAGKERATKTDYYFLCYEDVPEEPAEGGDGEGKGETVAIGNVVRMWSIGQWVQTQPEPVTDDIYEWVLCWVPQAQYHRLLCLGGEEPTACSATDCLLGALFSHRAQWKAPMLKVKGRQRLHEIEQEIHRELSVTLSQCHQSPGEVAMEGQQLLTDKAKPWVTSHEHLGSAALMSGDTAGMLSEKQAQPEIRSDEMLQVEFLSQTQVEIPQEVREVMDSLLDKVADGEAQEKKAEVFKANLIPYPSSSSAVNVMKVLESQVDKREKVEVLDLSTCPILQTALTDIETTMKTAYKTMPKQIVVLGSTIKHIITQASSITEDEEMSNTQQSIDAYEVAKAVINNLEEVLGPKPVLARALGIRLIISGELFNDFVVKFILKLHPMNGHGTKQLDQQALLLLVVKMASVAFNILRKIPGISVDEKLCPPFCNMRQTVLHMQSAMIHQFGTTIKIKKLVSMKDPVIISTIPSAICEGILMVYKGISDTYPLQVLGPQRPIARSCEEAMESKALCSSPLPEDLRKTIYNHYGSQVGKLALFQKAFPLNDHIKLDYIHRVSLPRSSNRDVVWIDPKYFVGDDDEEVVTSSNTVPVNPLALDVSQAAFLKQFPQTDVFESTTKDCGKPVQDQALCRRRQRQRGTNQR